MLVRKRSKHRPNRPKTINQVSFASKRNRDQLQSRPNQVEISRLTNCLQTHSLLCTLMVSTGSCRVYSSMYFRGQWPTRSVDQHQANLQHPQLHRIHRATDRKTYIRGAYFVKDSAQSAHSRTGQCTVKPTHIQTLSLFSEPENDSRIITSNAPATSSPGRHGICDTSTKKKLSISTSTSRVSFTQTRPLHPSPPLTRHRQANAHPMHHLDALQLLQHISCPEHAALEGCRVDLIQREAGSQQGKRLGCLGLEV